MSWVLGYWGREAPNLKTRFKSVHSPPLHQVSTHQLIITAGGLPETCILNTTTDGERGCLILGVGIRTGLDGSRILSPEDWLKAIDTNEAPNNIDGHFVIVRWTESGIEIQNDVLGVRTLFLTELGKDQLCFSTRLDWIAQIHGGTRLEERAFSTHWLTFSQMSYDSLLTDVQRLGPGGNIRINSKRVANTHTPWLPKNQTADSTRLADRIRSSVQLTPPEGLGISLGLSGGLDSRVLLSQLLRGPHSPNPHVFGFPGDPDRVIAKRISAGENLPLREFDLPLPRPEKLIEELKEFVSETNLINPASTWTKLRHFSGIHASGQVLVDGANGEIGRRQFLNRLAVSGKSALKNRDPEAVFRFLRLSRTDCFNTEFIKRLLQHAVNQISQALDLLPGKDRFSQVENLVDLLAVRYRISNYGGLGQAYTDARAVNFVPLSQPSFVNAVFDTSLADRRNAKIYRSVIAQDRPSLTKYPMTKYGAFLPYRLPTVAAWAWAKVKNKAGLAFADPSAEMMLHHLRPFIMDTVRSQMVAGYGPYDVKKIRVLADAFYSGNSSTAQQLDWWLTFELWRQGLSPGS